MSLKRERQLLADDARDRAIRKHIDAEIAARESRKINHELRRQRLVKPHPRGEFGFDFRRRARAQQNRRRIARRRADHHKKKRHRQQGDDERKPDSSQRITQHRKSNLRVVAVAVDFRAPYALRK